LIEFKWRVPDIRLAPQLGPLDRRQRLLPPLAATPRDVTVAALSQNASMSFGAGIAPQRLEPRSLVQ